MYRRALLQTLLVLPALSLLSGAETVVHAFPDLGFRRPLTCGQLANGFGALENEDVEVTEVHISKALWKEWNIQDKFHMFPPDTAQERLWGARVVLHDADDIVLRGRRDDDEFSLRLAEGVEPTVTSQSMKRLHQMVAQGFSPLGLSERESSMSVAFKLLYG